MAEKELTIIRSAIGSPSSMGILKFLLERGVRIIGTDIISQIAGKFFVDAFYKVPKASHASDVIRAYKNIALRETADWIVSGPEEEILLLQKHEDIFKRLHTRIFHPCLKSLRLCVDKWELYKFFMEFPQVRVPETYRADQWRLRGKMKFVLKPRRGRGGKGVIIAPPYDISEHLKTKVMKDYLVQQYVNGSEFTVDVLGDSQGRLVHGVVRERIVVDSGISICGRTVREKPLFDITEEICSRLPLSGANCLQFIRKDGRYYLTDINPRFGGGFILSLKASRTLRRHLMSLLKNPEGKYQGPCFDFNEIEMYRYYEEYFSI